MEKYCANLIAIPCNDTGRQSPMDYMVSCGYQGRLCPVCEVAALKAERDKLRAELAATKRHNKDLIDHISGERRWLGSNVGVLLKGDYARLPIPPMEDEG